VLVNNVGGMWPTRRETVDGIEAAFALNHLSPVVLTTALLGALRSGAPSRIVDVMSSSITVATVEGMPTFDAVEQDGEYHGMAVTGRAKLAHLAHNQDLARELAADGVTVLAADPLGPAAAATPNAAEMTPEMTPEMLPPVLRHLWEPIQAGMRPASGVVDAIVAAAVDPAFEGRSGLVLGPDGAPSEDLLRFVTPEVSASVRALTRRVLHS
jgi:NAD(P)-dependent dehydrogenase (short-subunit alcohol dehydrogenase family)